METTSTLIWNNAPTLCFRYTDHGAKRYVVALQMDGTFSATELGPAAVALVANNRPTRAQMMAGAAQTVRIGVYGTEDAAKEACALRALGGIS